MSLLDASGMSIVWEWHDGSYDRVQIQANATGCSVSGRHGDTRYLIGLDAEFACRTLEVSSGAQALTLNRTKAGWLSMDGVLVPHSAKCRDLDLGWTALTNTFPIRRLMAANQPTGTFEVLMIGLPHLDIRVVEQSYTRQEGGWLYQNNDNGYSTLLSVDKNGLVMDYPDLCSRKDLGR